MCVPSTPEAIGGPVDLTVADLSFISLRLVLPALAACTGADGDLVLMVKPQFEVGKERVGAGGVVRDPALRAEAVLDVAAAAARLGLALCRRGGQPAARAERQRGVLRMVAPGRASRRPATGCAQWSRPGPQGRPPRLTRGPRPRRCSG